MTRLPTDPIERQIESALRPGEFIYDRACFLFVSDLDRVAADIWSLTRSDPARATALCEAFLAGCRQKVEELDDSSGSFGQFVQDLICLWIKARQGSGAVADKTASTLLAWADDDPYAFCHQIEKDAAAAFNKAGLTSEDCLALARLLTARKPAEALAWVERGRGLDRKSQIRSTADFGLDQFHRELLTRLGRQDEALEAAWANFRKDPSKYTYDDLMKFVPKAERADWHERALDAAKDASWIRCWNCWSKPGRSSDWRNWCAVRATALSNT
jgi:hypothetical protein